jgi:hypothetical protein
MSGSPLTRAKKNNRPPARRGRTRIGGHRQATLPRLPRRCIVSVKVGPQEGRRRVSRRRPLVTRTHCRPLFRGQTPKAAKQPTISANERFHRSPLFRGQHLKEEFDALNLRIVIQLKPGPCHRRARLGRCDGLWKARTGKEGD